MSLMHPCKTCKQTSSDSVVSAAREEILSTAGSTPQSKMDTQDEPTGGENDPDDDDDDDLDDLDDDDDDDIVEELDLDEDMIGHMDDLEDDEGTDSGLGSQEMSTAEGSPHPGPPLQTAAAMLHAMSTGADLLPSSPADNKNTATGIERSRHYSGEPQPAPSSPASSPSLHSVASSQAIVPPVVSAPPHCIQIQMEV